MPSCSPIGFNERKDGSSVDSLEQDYQDYNQTS